MPEDPERPAGKHIELAVAVVPAIATRAKPDPLFLLAGGPGQGAIEGFAPLLGAFAGIHRERDLVLVDQRGTGGSNRLDCDMPDDALESAEISPAEIRRLARECLAKLPGRPEFYTTSIAVRDLDAVRAALGYEKHQPVRRLLWHARRAALRAPLPGAHAHDHARLRRAAYARAGAADRH